MSTSRYRTTVKGGTRPKPPRASRAKPRAMREVKLTVGAKKEARRVAMVAQIKEAREQQIYWTERRVLADLRDERAICGARALAWAMTVRALVASLNGKVAA